MTNLEAPRAAGANLQEKLILLLTIAATGGAMDRGEFVQSFACLTECTAEEADAALRRAEADGHVIYHEG